MLGILAPAGWLMLAFATGLLGSVTRQLPRLEPGQGLTNLNFLAAVTVLLLSVAMMALCSWLWHASTGAWQVIDNVRS